MSLVELKISSTLAQKSVVEEMIYQSTVNLLRRIGWRYINVKCFTPTKYQLDGFRVGLAVVSCYLTFLKQYSTLPTISRNIPLFYYSQLVHEIH